MIGPPLGGQESDLEKENEDSLCADCLPSEFSCELEVLNAHNENNFDDDRNDDRVETTAPTTSKKPKKRKMGNGRKSI